MSIIEEREGRDVQDHRRITEQRIHQTLKVTSNSTSIFCRKKNGKKRIVQDYRYLNKWIIKNNYSLSPILEIIKNIGIKKVFTNLDLQQGYNNIWIKEGDKWKTVFTTLQELFESSVIFFELTNSFQMMINKLLQDLINTGEIVSFIDDIIVGIKEEGKKQ